ncbi:MAG: MarC family protein [Alphaproteobacteria bacterium]|nr:MarC family protein [Alphaproteobacteria bacterium]
MTAILVDSFVIFGVVIDPIGTAVIFAALTHDWSRQEQRDAAIRGVSVASILFLVFALAGAPLLRALGISLAAFHIAGGILLFLLATDMAFARPSGIHAPTLPEREEARRRDDVAVFPLAFPLLAGPGALTSTVLLVGRAGTPIGGAVVIAALAVVLVLTFAALLSAARLSHLLGITGANVISRVLGLILAALAAQFVLDGLATSGLHL